MANDFEHVFTANWPRIYQLALRMTRNEDDAQEVAQETFFRAYAAWDRFEGRSEVTTWLFRIAVNTCRQQMIKRRRLEQPSEEPFEACAPPERDAALDEKLALLNDALAQIAPAHRLVLTLFCIDGLKHEQIAGILNVPVGTVWSRLHKARQVLESKINFLSRAAT